jgi:ribonuclease E
MPTNKMLIDAAHPEETRVVVLRGNKVEEFDFEAAERQQLRGNIYLAKVTRVEPSLQAAFVEYGGNRHGFLAFSEIHPDYYQIPVADRLALLEEQAREDAEDAAEDQADDGEDNDSVSEAPATDEQDADAEAAESADTDDDGPDSVAAVADAGDSVSEAPEDEGESSDSDAARRETEVADVHAAGNDGDAAEDNGEDDDDDEPVAEAVEDVGGDDALEEVPQRRKPRPRQYKIQEVIKRRQVLLVQVVKEERGNKGAALTTYLSLAGRYSVLMPNTARGGGISRKITNVTDRKRLKSIAQELEVPEGMGVILRTAGASRTKAEIKRDFEYLLRLWENVRELTLKSTAPNLVYEEGSLVKRSIRDLYSKEVEEVLVAGDDAYREAKDFMRMLMPSHARNVQPYKDDVPIFSRYGVEPQLDAMFSPQVTLKSGGYIVINQTEALVAIDVNSGRSTREHSIEDTALQTNLEAAAEVARQLRLRDLAGLIVIDFIDMEEKRNNRSVERKLKDCLKADRARIQVGRISHFGLMEMSRQRIRTGVLESSTEQCSVCHGTGQVRSVSSLALQILRSLEDHLLRNSNHHLRVCTRPDVALYVLNQKRGHLSELEQRFSLNITIVASPPENGSPFVIERGEAVGADRPRPVSAVAMLDVADTDEEEAQAEAEAGGKKRKRRRRKRRGGEDEMEQSAAGAEEAEGGEEHAGETAAAAEGDGEEDGGEPRKRRKRGRRGGRRRRRSEDSEQAAATETAVEAESAEAPAEEAASGDGDVAPEVETEAEAGADEAGADEARGRKPRQRRSRKAEAEEAATEVMAEAQGSNGAETAYAQRNGEQPAESARDDAASEEPASASADEAIKDTVKADKPKRSGWWQRRSFF